GHITVSIGRRELIAAFAVAAAWPRTVSGQQPSVPTIGFLNAGSAGAFSELAAAFRQGLETAGYGEGQNVRVEYRWAEGRHERLPALAAELVERRVAAIASTGGPAVVEAAARATTTIPIIFVSSDIILKMGLIASLNRPNGNITGMVMSANAL